MGVDCTRARIQQAKAAARLRDHGRAAVLSRARLLATLSRRHVDVSERAFAGACAIRACAGGSTPSGASPASAPSCWKADSSLIDCRRRRPQELERLALALTGHDPQRTLERGYVLVQSSDGEPLLAAEAARAADQVGLRFAKDASREDPPPVSAG